MIGTDRDKDRVEAFEWISPERKEILFQNIGFRERSDDMAVVTIYRYEELNVTVLIHDDEMLSEKERREVVERLFRYEEEACARTHCRDGQKEGEGRS